MHISKRTLLAEKFKKDIFFKIELLPKHPERHAPDKYKLKNDGSFRAFELHHYRISYKYSKKEIRILRVRHTKMNPENY
ncbi:MAG: type II toxin-antitoxin system RelE/ParE family toxin [Chitinophagaceae bacterium]